VRERYRLLPYLYTLFAEAALDGTPPMRPLWYEFASDEQTFSDETCFLLGQALLVRIIAEPGITSASLRLPGGREQLWYHGHTLARVGTGGSTITLDAPAERIPVLLRGGAIVPRKERLRRASAQMAYDPYTLLVAPDGAGAAAGELYVDDGVSHGYEDGEFDWRHFKLEQGGRVLTCSAHAGRPAGAADAASKAKTIAAGVERLVLLGQSKAPARVTIAADGAAPRELTFVHNAASSVLIVRKPDVSIAADWTVTLHD
jgi:alpha 1,3-glucosidase